jgi:hypothetical protein
MGGTGCARRGSRLFTHSNCGVFIAGRCTIVRRTSLRSCSSSERSESQNPCSACLAPQYADCSGMPRYASADPTWTIDPRLRGSIRRSAASVP